MYTIYHMAVDTLQNFGANCLFGIPCGTRSHKERSLRIVAALREPVEARMDELKADKVA